MLTYRKTKKSVENIPTKGELLTTFFDKWKIEEKPDVEYISLSNAENRVAAKDLFSKTTLPVFRSATMDGVGVSYERFKTEDALNWKLNIDYCRADTGDDFPDAFDTVVPIEGVTFTKTGGIRWEKEVFEKLEKGQSISSTGSKLSLGEYLVEKGSFLNSLKINLLAMGGYSVVLVFRKPKVIYIPTGSELVPAGIPPKRNENSESNSYMVSAMLKSFGAEPIIYPLCNDIESDLSTLIGRAILEADIVLVNGGSSKGSEDFNSRLVEKDAEFFQHYVRSAPGFPVGIGLVNQHPVINIPGPPTATFAVMHWLVKSLIDRKLGIEKVVSKKTYAKLTEDLVGSDIMDLYIYAEIKEKSDGLWITPMDKKSRASQNLGQCNAVIILDALSNYSAGDIIEAEWV